MIAHFGRQGTSILLILLAGLVGYIAYTGTLPDTVGMKGLKQQKDGSQRSRPVKPWRPRPTARSGSWRADGRGPAAQAGELPREPVAAAAAGAGAERSAELLDDISTRAKIRGVNLAEVAPLPEERGPAPFDDLQVQHAVMGHYDQIGEFLGDIASLQRIIVPVDLTIAPANAASAKALGDSSGHARGEVPDPHLW